MRIRRYLDHAALVLVSAAAVVTVVTIGYAVLQILSYILRPLRP